MHLIGGIRGIEDVLTIFEINRNKGGGTTIKIGKFLIIFILGKKVYTNYLKTATLTGVLHF